MHGSCYLESERGLVGKADRNEEERRKNDEFAAIGGGATLDRVLVSSIIPTITNGPIHADAEFSLE